VFITESTYCFSKYAYASSFAIIIGLYTMSWIPFDLGNSAMPELFIAQVYGYLLMMTIYVCLVIGLRVNRFVSGFSEFTDTPALWLIALNLIISMVVLILFQRKPRVIYLQRFMFISSGLLMLWLCSIESHVTTADLGYLVFLATSICVFGVFTLIDGYVKNLTGWKWLIPLVILHILFLAIYNLQPAFQSTAMRSWTQIISSILYIVVVVFALSWIIQNESAKHQNKKKTEETNKSTLANKISLFN
jgi:hypothetical protein